MDCGYLIGNGLFKAKAIQQVQLDWNSFIVVFTLGVCYASG